MYVINDAFKRTSQNIGNSYFLKDLWRTASQKRTQLN